MTINKQEEYMIKMFLLTIERLPVGELVKVKHGLLRRVELVDIEFTRRFKNVEEEKPAPSG